MNGAWILLGMMGAGKSSVGRLLADIADRAFLDTDAMLQARLGRTIAGIFQIYGEDAFRDHETSVLRSLEPGPYVLATGGGIVLRAENWVEFRRLGTTVFLDAPLDTLVSRLERSRKKRPLLASEDWQVKLASLLEFRLPLYCRADIQLRIEEEDLESTVEKLYALLEQKA